LPAPMPSASSTDTIQTVMSVPVTRSIATKRERHGTSSFRVKVQPGATNQIASSTRGVVPTDAIKAGEYGIASPLRQGERR
jgi:hypothetical protein